MKPSTKVILILICFLLYFNSLFNGFVWDDEEQILNNLPVHSITNFFQFFKESTFNSGGGGNLGGLYYKPLMTTFFSLIYTIFGPNPFFFHFFQISLHIASGVLVFLIFKHFFKDQNLLPFFLALIFLIHPINTEAVVYISDLQDILFFFFGVLALYRLIAKPLTRSNSIIIFLLLLASLLSKETGAAFFLINGFYVLFFRRKILFHFTVSAVSALSIYSLLRFALAGIYFNKHGLSPITIMTFSQRMLSVPKIIFSYFWTFILPQNLAINQHWAVKIMNGKDFFMPMIFDLLLFSLFLAGLIFLRRKKSPFFLIYLFFFAWLLLGLALHLQIFPLDLTYSDRWFYFPIVGLLGMIGAFTNQFKIKNLKFKVVVLALAITILTAFSIRTFIRTFNWRNGLILYGHDIKVSQGSFDLENNYGVELFRNGQLDEAAKHFEKSAQLAPNWWTNWNNLGVIAERQGNFSEAKIDYQKALVNGNYYLAYENLAVLLLFHESTKEAKLFVDNSLNKLPQNPKLWLVKTLSEYQLGNYAQATESARIFYLLSPGKQSYYLYSRLSQNLPLEF